MARPWTTLLAGLAGTLVVVGVSGAAADPVASSHHTTATHEVAGAASGRPTVSMVTLVTGDRVRITTQADGSRTVVPTPLSGRVARPYSIRYRGTAIEVVPSDARPLLRSGRLDPRLFDVAGLIAAGYDDASTKVLPVAARHAPGRGAVASHADGATLAGQETTGNSTPLGVRKNEAAAFWRWLTGPKPAEVGAPRPVGGALTAGVENLSLRLRPSAVRPATQPSAATTDAGAPARGSGAHPHARAAAGPQAATYSVLLRIIDRNGKLLTNLDEGFITQPVVLNLDTEDIYNLEPRKTGVGAQVPPGRYSFGEIIVTAHGFKPRSYTDLARPNFTVNGNLTMTLDARNAHEVTARIQAPSPKPIVTTFGTVEFFAGRPWTTLVTIPAGTNFRAFANTTSEVTDRAYNFAMFQSLNTGWGMYDLLVGAPQRIPATTSYEIRNADLAKIRSTFYSPGTGLDLDGVYFRESQLPGDVQVGLGGFYDTRLPSKQVHFTSPTFGSEPLPWSASLDVGPSPLALRYSELRTPVLLPAGESVEQPWSPAAYRPEASGERKGDQTMNITFEPFSPSVDNNRIIWWDTTGITGGATLKGTGVPADTVDAPFLLETGPQALPSAWYTLDLLARHTPTWSKYATSVHAFWKYQCHTPDVVHPMRLLNIRVSGAFDMYGRAPAGQPFRLDLTVDPPRETGTPQTVTLSVSFDDGKTWKDVPTTRDSTLDWHGIVNHPNKPNGFVSVRAKTVTDRSYVYSMTTIRAYGLVAATS
ncbi:hypothetical protein ABN028_14610 [Actinopolymorpha sp. B17G11]|uniref:hypothetical protein n=1 Tax=unclassified Actinopolymorpha TaxID=2627063 RepID=UPI0032D8CE7E